MFQSCSGLRKLSHDLDGYGTFITCTADSTALFNTTKIILSYHHPDNNHNQNNLDCKNRPKHPSTFDDWPSSIIFSPTEKRFSYYYDFQPHSSNPNPDLITVMSSKTKSGKLKYDRKKSLITLSIPENNWKKTFFLEINKLNGLVILTEHKK
ncbi:MAG: hypothetical protein K0S12_902 [Bacteroidetes bacterium]|nr:hypothetical protein [Bacteroidota bacterium]